MEADGNECPECHGEDEDCPLCHEGAGGNEEEIKRVSALAKRELEGTPIGQFDLFAG
jgi:hypothetical protein